MRRIDLALFVLTVLTLQVSVTVTTQQNFYNDEVPLSRSLGYAVKRSLGNNLEDMKISKEYLELYQEMLRASRESYEKVDEEEAKLETIVGKEKAELLKKGVIDRRRSISRMRSPVGRRRVRSQKTRREKLNSQSLRSHQQHIRHASSGGGRVGPKSVDSDSM